MDPPFLLPDESIEERIDSVLPLNFDLRSTSGSSQTDSVCGISGIIDIGRVA